MLLWTELALDMGQRCRTSTSLDIQKVEARFKHEGLSFLTITLPNFCKDFEKSLDRGRVDLNSFVGFRRKGGLPLFLGGFLDHVFDRGTGRLLQDPCMDSVQAVRQLTLVYSKVLVECSDARKQAAISSYLQCEKELKQDDKRYAKSLGQSQACSTSIPNPLRLGRDGRAGRQVGLPQEVSNLRNFRRLASLLFRDTFSELESLSYEGDFRGRHGPGATADRLRGNAKYDLCEWPQRLQLEFPYGDFAVASYRDHERLYARVQLLEPGAERPVKVTLVPKTLKTPRVIAIEPTAMQFIQQGIMEKLVYLLETDKTVSGMIGFTEQEPNQALAMQGSFLGDLATLDLSEASDRVSNQHVRAMFQNFPNTKRAVEACRSRKAEVLHLNGREEVVRLAKFASMGSALTFPIEAMVFLTVIFVGIERELNRQLTRKDVRSLSSQVRVYGDDLIVPVEYVQSVIRALGDFGHRVNAHKSFWTGKFRESCGKEFYDGHDVSVVRCRRTIPTSLTDVQEIISLVAFRNQLYLSGSWRTAKYLDGILGKLLPKYPVLDPGGKSGVKPELSESPLLGRVSFLGRRYDDLGRLILRSGDKIHGDLQVPITRGFKVVSKPPASPVSGEGALLKWFLKRGDQPFADVNHLERSGRPQAVDIKLRYARPY